MKTPLILLGFVLIFVQLTAQHSALEVKSCELNHGKSGAAFIQNKNQWHPNARFMAPVGGEMNVVWLESNALTYQFYHQEDLLKLHDVAHSSSESANVRQHAYKVEFLGALEPTLVGEERRKEHLNYIRGNDPSKWGQKVPLFDELTYQRLYQGIDLHFHYSHGHLKYEYLLEPGADPNLIQMQYTGADALRLRNGALVIKTSVQTIKEMPPVAYQEINGKQTEIACEYHLENNILSFVFPDGYDSTIPLVIDPEVVAATLSGTFGERNFGHTATFDNAGNIYAGGISFGPGYPTTSGAYDLDYNGGGTDVAISKYNPTGTELIYATYIGGSNEDYPHSIIADFNQQLYIYGSTNSLNYPTTSTAVQTSNSGQVEIFVTVLNADGSELVGSTYLGGSGVDGQNQSGQNSNYGDTYRGEIVIDGQNNIYVASMTSSINFPATENAFDQTLNTVSNGFSAQDGVVFKMNSDASILYWATYLGGDNADAALGLRVDNQSNVYVTGFAGASNFPTVGNVAQPNWPGGDENAFITKIASTGSSIMRSTFWGSSDGSEHAYFMDIDEDDNINIYGQTTGTMPVTPNTYSSAPGSKQFISALDPNLSEVVYSTVIGTGPGGFDYDFVPVAFMVDKCDNIYFSGYYAEPGLPLTPDAIDSNGDAFYLGVLEPMAADLSFGTYYGNANHVDGGTSRFDKSGTVYQGVCSCTWNGTVMNTNSDAWATSQSTDCDVGVFKIDFEVETVTAAATVVPSTSGCAPFNANFFYTGQDATEFFWYFEEGATSTLENPSHTFEEPGVYEIYLVASNPFACNQLDTNYLEVNVLSNENTAITTSFCDGGDLLYLDVATPNATYLWQNGYTGSTFPVGEAGTYYVEVAIDGCSHIDTFYVNEDIGLTPDLGDDLAACDVPNVTIDGTTTGAFTYLWSNGAESPSITLQESGTFWLAITDENNCIEYDTVNVQFGTTPIIELGTDQLLCDDETYTLDASFNGSNYAWSNGATTPSITVTEAGTYSVVVDNNGCTATDEVTVNYHPEFNLSVDVVPIECSGDCNASITIAASGGAGNLQYQWNTGETTPSLANLCPGFYALTITDAVNCEYFYEVDLLNPDFLAFEGDWQNLMCAGDNSGVISGINVSGGIPPYQFSLDGENFTDNTSFTGLAAGNYTLYLQDDVGCTIAQEITVTEPPEFYVDAGPDMEIELGEFATLNGQVLPMFGQNIYWENDPSLSCLDCLRPNAGPYETTEYTLVAVDPNTGCTQTDAVIVYVDKVRGVYIPDAFSPNGDGVNDFFAIYSHVGVKEVLDFKIFDRWGDLVFENINFAPNNDKIGWDGTFRGKPMNTGVFAFYAEVEFLDGEVILYKGSVTLVR